MLIGHKSTIPLAARFLTVGNPNKFGRGVRYRSYYVHSFASNTSELRSSASFAGYHSAISNITFRNFRF
jgi:hypothetical protein